MPSHLLSRRHRVALLWSLVVAVLLVTPGGKIGGLAAREWLDKPLHGLVFAVHCALLTRALAGPARSGRRRAAAVSALYALLLETVQLWIPGRAWEWGDLAAGIAGIAAAACLLGRARARLPGAS